MRNRIAEARRKAGMTQQELAKAAGVSRTTIWALEKNIATTVLSSTILSIAHVLDTTVDDLFFEEKV